MAEKENKKLTMEDMEQVAGGTVTELEKLVRAGLSSINPNLRTVCAKLARTPIAAVAEAYAMESVLKDMGIKANISVGFCGTGIASKPNTYYDTKEQRSLTQSEVEDRLRSA